MEEAFYTYVESKHKQVKEDLVEIFFNKQFIKVEYGKIGEDGERNFRKRFTTAEDAYKFLFETGLVTDRIITLPLLGVTEFAEFLNIPTSKLSNMYSKQRKGETVNPPLPAPIQVLAATSIWTFEQAKDYKIEFDNYTPVKGRPKNNTKNEETPVV